MTLIAWCGRLGRAVAAAIGSGWRWHLELIGDVADELADLIDELWYGPGLFWCAWWCAVAAFVVVLVS